MTRRRLDLNPMFQLARRADHAGEFHTMVWFTPKRLALVMLLPFLIGVVRDVLLPTRSPWFMDFDALSCAGVAVNTGQPIYTGHLVCPGATPTSFVYTPVVAQVVAALERHFGTSFFAASYGAVFFLIVVLVARALVTEDAQLAARAPFLLDLSASLLRSGNFSIMLHGVLLVARRRLAVWPVLMALIVMLAGVAKPPFAVYAALLLFLDRPMSQRLALALVAAAVPVAYCVYFRIGQPALFEQWWQLISFYGLQVERGAGFLGLPWVSSITWMPGLAALYAGYVALMIAAGLSLAHLRLSSEIDRLALGIAVCLLLYPRLRGYDLYTLPVGMGVAVSTFRGIGRATPVHLSWALVVAMLVFAIIGGRAGNVLAVRADALLLLSLAAVAVLQTRKRASGAAALLTRPRETMDRQDRRVG
jgi:hypothetical protein